MMRLGLTPRMRRTYDFICALLDTVGVPPTYQEMATHVGLKNRSGVVPIIKDLEARGWIVRRPGCARSIERAPADNPIPFPTKKGSPMGVQGFSITEDSEVEIVLDAILTGFKSGWSNEDMADEYARHGVLVEAGDISNALARHRDAQHNEQVAA